MTPLEDVVNWEIFLWCLYKLGGASDFVDVETVFIDCFDTAPQRFAWRTREDIPDYKKCSKALRDAEAKSPPLLIKTRNGFARQLTVEGQRWIESYRSKLERILHGSESVPEPKQRPRSRQLSQFERSEAFAQWTERGTVPAEKWRIAEVLRCSPDSSPSIWQGRLQTMRAMAFSVKKEQIVQFLDEVFREHSDWFAGEVG